LPVEVRFGSDPDVSITQQLKSQQRKLVAIELKGGTDVSNVWNRLGEAEKSHPSFVPGSIHNVVEVEEMGCRGRFLAGLLQRYRVADHIDSQYGP
jgi:hypothetical protein